MTAQTPKDQKAQQIAFSLMAAKGEKTDAKTRKEERRIAARNEATRAHYRKMIYPYTMTDEELKIEEYGQPSPETWERICYYRDLKKAKIKPDNEA